MTAIRGRRPAAPRSGPRELPDRFIDRHEAAELLGMSEQILRADVVTNRLRIPRHKFGKSVRYSLRELLAWTEAHRVSLPGAGRAA